MRREFLFRVTRRASPQTRATEVKYVSAPDHVSAANKSGFQKRWFGDSIKIQRVRKIGD